MDSIIKRFDCIPDADLNLCTARGIAYQADMATGRVPYDADYLAKVAAYENTDIAKAVNAGRCALLLRHVSKGAQVLDIGAGTGAFCRAARSWGLAANGYEVMRPAVKRLQDENIYSDKDPSSYDAVTLWDVIEHMEDPELLLRAVPKGTKLFASIPVFDDLTRIRESKHYRPGEHLYHWTATGFVAWMALYGYRLLERSAHETDAGRESIAAFAFCRDLPDYHDHVAAYKEMHATRYYGGSATELYLDTVAGVVRELKPRSIIDYGCGRSDLAAHFYLDGKRRIARFDPAIPEFEPMPEGTFDLGLCTDLMEHIPMASVDIALAQLRAKTGTVLFTISTKLARAKLPDGRNAHVTILSRDEWTRWIADYFGPVRVLPSKWETELVLLAGEREPVVAFSEAGPDQGRQPVGQVFSIVDTIWL